MGCLMIHWVCIATMCQSRLAGCTVCERRKSGCCKWRKGSRQLVLCCAAWRTVRPPQLLLMLPLTTAVAVIGAVAAAVSVNGQLYSKATRKRIGFVLQDDVLYESLTVKVRERLPSSKVYSTRHDA